jgi:hypothetical protein
MNVNDINKKNRRRNRKGTKHGIQTSMLMSNALWGGWRGEGRCEVVKVAINSGQLKHTI